MQTPHRETGTCPPRDVLLRTPRASSDHCHAKKTEKKMYTFATFSVFNTKKPDAVVKTICPSGIMGAARAMEIAENTRSSEGELTLLTRDIVRWDCTPWCRHHDAIKGQKTRQSSPRKIATGSGKRWREREREKSRCIGDVHAITFLVTCVHVSTIQAFG